MTAIPGHGCGDSKVFDGRAAGVLCSFRGRAVLEGCEFHGNTGAWARIEAGGSLLLVRCEARDGRAAGLHLLKDAEATLEECVVQRNARGGILLGPGAAAPVLRGGNRLQDEGVRETQEASTAGLGPTGVPTRRSAHGITGPAGRGREP